MLPGYDVLMQVLADAMSSQIEFAERAVRATVEAGLKMADLGTMVDLIA